MKTYHKPATLTRPMDALDRQRCGILDLADTARGALADAAAVRDDRRQLAGIVLRQRVKLRHQRRMLRGRLDVIEDLRAKILAAELRLSVQGESLAGHQARMQRMEIRALNQALMVNGLERQLHAKLSEYFPARDGAQPMLRPEEA